MSGILQGIGDALIPVTPATSSSHLLSSLSPAIPRQNNFFVDTLNGNGNQTNERSHLKPGSNLEVAEISEKRSALHKMKEEFEHNLRVISMLSSDESIPATTVPRG